jgi:hypothetical protein
MRGAMHAMLLDLLLDFFVSVYPEKGKEVFRSDLLMSV